MSDLNVVVIAGNCASDPETKEFEWGTVTKFRIANNIWNGKEKREVPSFFSVEALKSKPAAEWMKKGDKIAVEGQIVIEQWDKDGVTQYYTKIKSFNGVTVFQKGAAASDDDSW